MKLWFSYSKAFGPILGLLGAVLFFGGCREVPKTARLQTANNLKFVQCNQSPTEILVNTTDGTAAVDEVVFVCVGSQLSWKTPDNAAPPFHVVFDSSPFGSGKKQIDSQNGATGGELVANLQPKRRAVVYKYRLLFGPDVNHPVAEFDPHIIPMGP